MKQPPSKIQKLKVKSPKVCEARSLSSKVIYVDGTPYIKLEKTAVHLDKNSNEILSSRSLDQVHSSRLLSSHDDNKGIQDSL